MAVGVTEATVSGVMATGDVSATGEMTRAVLGVGAGELRESTDCGRVASQPVRATTRRRVRTRMPADLSQRRVMPNLSDTACARAPPPIAFLAMIAQTAAQFNRGPRSQYLLAVSRHRRLFADRLARAEFCSKANADPVLEAPAVAITSVFAARSLLSLLSVYSVVHSSLAPGGAARFDRHRQKRYNRAREFAL